jgi:hypothetical protein
LTLKSTSASTMNSATSTNAGPPEGGRPVRSR